MRAVVVGGSGQIGGWLLRVLADRGHEAEGTYATAPYPGAHPARRRRPRPARPRWLRDQRPDVVFYPAGFTWVDGCERDPARARRPTCEQPLEPRPGRRRTRGAVRLLLDRLRLRRRRRPVRRGLARQPALGLRPGQARGRGRPGRGAGRPRPDAPDVWVFGPNGRGRISPISSSRALSAGKELACPSDQVSNPSYGPDVARAAVALVEQGRSGVVHAAGPEVMGRVAFARADRRGVRPRPDLIVPGPPPSSARRPPARSGGGCSRPGSTPGSPAPSGPLSEALVDFRGRVDGVEGWADPFGGARIIGAGTRMDQERGDRSHHVDEGGADECRRWGLRRGRRRRGGRAPAPGGGRRDDELQPQGPGRGLGVQDPPVEPATFRNPAKMRAILDEENRRGGWVLVEKFDNHRIRLKRPARDKGRRGGPRRRPLRPVPDRGGRCRAGRSPRSSARAS